VDSLIGARYWHGFGKRIGIFSDRYLPQTDGVSYSIETFRVELERLGHEVYVLAPRPTWRYKEQTKRVIRFAAMKGLFWDDSLASFYVPPAALRQIEKLKLDIIHCQTPGPIGLLGYYYALRHKIPLVTTYHTDLYEYVKHYRKVLPGTIALSLLAPVITGGGMSDYRSTLLSIRPERSVDKWNQKIVVRSLTLLHKHCDLVIIPSFKLEKQLLSWHNTPKMAILPTGVDKIPASERDIKALQRKYQLSVQDQIILFVGRIGTEKNIGLLIRAFATIGKRNSRAKLMIVGDGDDLRFFKEQAAATPYADRIIFTGRIDRHKLGAVYEIANVLGFPSLTDTQGMVVNEAACAGVPIVMVDPDISEVVRDGENGFISRNSARDFAAKIIRILSNKELQEEMSKRSIKLAAEVSASKQAVKLLRLYHETIEQHNETFAKEQPSSGTDSAEPLEGRGIDRQRGSR
jgi:glycosyltransferase involved in cell wall biosynthesis